MRRWDAQAQAPFLWNAEKRIFISYDDPESLRVKSRYVLERGLAGVMFWEYYADRPGRSWTRWSTGCAVEGARLVSAIRGTRTTCRGFPCPKTQDNIQTRAPPPASQG